jgi:signal transduction histidine kinase
MVAWLRRELVDPRTYGRIGYLLLAGLLGVTEFVFLVVAISLGVGLAITLIGIPILVLSVYAWGGLAEGERRIIAALTGTVIPNPYRPVPEGASRWGRLRARLADPATWKDLVFLLLQFPFGLVSFVLAVTVLSLGIHGVALPLWYWALPDGMDYGFWTIDTLPEALAVVPVGAALLLLGIPALSALGRLYVGYAEVLLGSNVDPAVTAEMTGLRDARSRIIEAADAERRRIERDLHDGAQQRLVALALTLRMAEKRAAEGKDASELVRQAGDEAGLALKELRDLARGIHPAILTNRGLPAALGDLAGRTSVPVEVVDAPGERLPDQVEAAAYFVVSECLANIDKHAGATAATVSVTPRNGNLLVTVRDDGVGGAKLDGGSGLQGLEDRVGALDGTLAVDSLPGEGTAVRASIPLVESVEGLSFGPAPQRVLSDEEATQLQDRRRGGLRVRATILAAVSLVILIVWAFTGAPNAWPVWPLLGLGLIAALDAWMVLGMPPARRSDLDGEPDPRALRRRRGVRAAAGKLAIVNLFLIGIWGAAGAGYFWPAWVMLGSAVLVALKAAPWSHAWMERAQGAP